MKEYLVIVSEKKSHGKYGKQKIIGYYVDAESIEDAQKRTVNIVSTSHWAEVLKYVEMNEKEKARFIGCSISDLINWLCYKVGDIYAERKFSYKAVLVKK